MKILLVMLLSGVANAMPCNQRHYDYVYVSIVQAALRKTLVDNNTTAEVLEERNRGINFMRELCNGQRSTYELENPLKFYRGKKCD